MDALACGYARKGDIHHGRVGAGLTLDMAVGRLQGGPLEKGQFEKKAKAHAHAVTRFSSTYQSDEEE
jgi:hypothetical protein